MIEVCPRVTIIVPVFNKVEYLTNALETIANQTFQDFECILVDDGSNDGSGEICDRFVLKDSRFRAIHTNNFGVSHARNVALDNARGEYVVFIDADDEVDSEYLSNLISLKEQHCADVVISWICDMNEKGELLRRRFPIKPGLYSVDDLIKSFAKIQFESGIFGWCVSKIVPLGLINSIRFDEELTLAEDLDFYLKVYKKTSTLYLDNSVHYYYRQNTTNSSVKKDEDIDYIAQLKLLLKIKRFLIEKNAWNEENQKIIENKTSDYVYFTLFHCKLEQFEERFNDVTSLWANTNKQLTSSGGFKRMVLAAAQKNDMKKAKFFVSAYRYLRKAVKGNG